MSDPGVAFRCATLPTAWRLLGMGAAPPDFAMPEAAEDAIEALALAAGRRSRRVILDGRWWHQAPVPMIARVSDRRSVARQGEAAPSASSASGTGWVALIPQPVSGYRMVTTFPDDATTEEFPVDEKAAARLAPFAFTFHERFAPRALKPTDILGLAFRYAGDHLNARLRRTLGRGVEELR